MLETPVIVALLGSATSVGLAIWSLVTARVAKARALEAEELSKRTEHIRIKALDAGASVLKALTEYRISIETAAKLVELRGGYLVDDDMPMMLSAAQAYSALRRCTLENAIYLSDDIVSKVESMVVNGDLSPAILPTRVREARELHESLVSLFRDVYLSSSTVRPHHLLSRLAHTSTRNG